MSIMPVKRSVRWLLWFVVYGLLLSLLLWFHRFVVLGQTFEGGMALRFMLFAFILSSIVNGFGWLGTRWVWLMTTLGILIGTVLMFVYVMRDLTGWEDLVSLLVFLQCAVFGFAIGLLIEGIQWMVRKRRR